MHELSIAANLVEIAAQAAAEAGAARVTRVDIRVGQLSCVHPDALLFCYEAATKDTILEGSQLRITDVPLVIYCRTCDKEVRPPSLQSCCCPDCGQFSGDLRQGNELDLERIEIEDAPIEESPIEASPTKAD